MSWFSRSIANSLKTESPDSGSDDEISKTGENQTKRENEGEKGGSESGEEENPGRGVKEDISELTKTFTRQLWGVASFLAPAASSPTAHSSSSDSSRPSISQDPDPDPEPEATNSPRLASIRNDFAEIGGRFRTGISRISGNKAVTEISKIASSFLPFASEEEKYGDAVGVTDEVLAFARNISMHPETWLDFPLFIDDDDYDDFDMSDTQQEHALAVERLAPRLAALRIELCPSHMNEGCFWKIYFVLLHSRLNKHDAELLSTPQIVEARALWLQVLQNSTKPDPDRFGRSTSYAKETVGSAEEQITLSSNGVSETTPMRTYASEPVKSTPTADIVTEKHPVTSTEMRIIDKSVVEEGPIIQTTNKDSLSGASKSNDQKYEEECDDWLEEDNTELGGATIPLGNEDDVSFSDLEDDDDEGAHMSAKTVTVSDSSVKDSREGVQLSKTPDESVKDVHAPGTGCHQTKESSDWLNIDGLDSEQNCKDLHNMCASTVDIYIEIFFVFLDIWL